MSHWRITSPCQACTTATSEVEQAVWTLTAGPVRSMRLATRVAM